MSWARSEYPLPGSVFLDTSDPETARREMSKILAPHAMVPSDITVPFHARHHHARLTGMSVNYIEYASDVNISADLSRRFYLIHHVLHGACRLGGGQPEQTVRSGEIAVINPTEPFTVRTSDSCGQIVIKLETKILDDAAKSRFSIPSDNAVRFERSRRPSNSEPVRRVIELICAEADTGGKKVSGPRTEQALADLLAVTLLECLPHSLTDQIRRDSGEAGIAPWYVKRVEEFIDLHAEKPLKISDMTEVAGVSERTLYNGFRRWRGVSPKSYLKTVRLDRVRTELLGPDSKNRSVSDIAREYGFRHMGNFARDYGKRFGEKPSKTRRFGTVAPE